MLAALTEDMAGTTVKLKVKGLLFGIVSTKLPATLFSAIAMNLEDTPGGRGVYTMMIVNPVVYVSPKRSVAVT